MSYRRGYLGSTSRWSVYGDASREFDSLLKAHAAYPPTPFNSIPSTRYGRVGASESAAPAASTESATASGHAASASAGIFPKYNPWYTAYTPYYPTYYRGYSYMITSNRDYLNPGFLEPDRDEHSRVERYRELQQQEDERKKMINQTKTHYAKLVGQVPQIGIPRESQRTDYSRLARYLSTYGAKDTTNLLRFLDSGCTKEPIAVEVPKRIEDAEDDDDDDEGWVKANISVRARPSAATTTTKTVAPAATTPAAKSERRPFRYAGRGAARGGAVAAARAKVPKRRETETVYVVPETLSEEDLAKERIRRDTDFLMAGVVL